MIVINIPECKVWKQSNGHYLSKWRNQNLKSLENGQEHWFASVINARRIWFVRVLARVREIAWAV